MEKKSIYRFLVVVICLQFTHAVNASIVEVNGVTDIDMNKKPLVVEFYSPSCPHCKIMIPRYQQVANKYGNRVCFYTVSVTNMGLTQECAKKMRVEINGVPHFVFIDGNGNSSQMKGQMGEGALDNKVKNL